MKKIILSGIVTGLLLGSNVQAFGLSGMSASVPGTSSASSTSSVDSDAIMEAVLSKIDSAKKLKEESDAIKAEMTNAISIAIGMIASADYTLGYLNTALQGATSAEKAREVFNTGVSNIINAKKNPSGTIKDQGSVIGTATGSTRDNISNLETLSNSSDADLEKSIKDINGTLEALNLANGYLTEISSSSSVASSKIDNAIDTFKGKGVTVAIESAKMSAILAIQAKEIQKTIKSVSKDPMKAAKVLPKLKKILTSITTLTTTFTDYKADYDYIENNSATISTAAVEATKKINSANSISADFLAKIEAIAIKRGELAENYEEAKNNSSKEVQKLAFAMSKNIDYEEEE